MAEIIHYPEIFAYAASGYQAGREKGRKSPIKKNQSFTPRLVETAEQFERTKSETTKALKNLVAADLKNKQDNLKLALFIEEEVLKVVQLLMDFNVTHFPLDLVEIEALVNTVIDEQMLAQTE